MPTWEIRITRDVVQSRGPGLTNKRTVGRYAIFHDGNLAERYVSQDFQAPLFGTSAESPGPSQNDHIAHDNEPSRVLPGRYQLATFRGDVHYATYGYYPTDDVRKWFKPCVALMLESGPRTGILIHPGRDEFVSSIGCINLCTSLPNPAEPISYGSSRARVIAMIEDMRDCLGAAFPSTNGRPIPGAFAVVAGDPPTPGD